VKFRRNKFGAKKTVVDGKIFDSIKEAKRYKELVLLQSTGIISDLTCQVTFRLDVNGLLICKYRADFVYRENGHHVVEDVKGARTREYLLKKKLMRAVHGIDILET
jgi:hypothetical protein